MLNVERTAIDLDDYPKLIESFAVARQRDWNALVAPLSPATPEVKTGLLELFTVLRQLARMTSAGETSLYAPNGEGEAFVLTQVHPLHRVWATGVVVLAADDARTVSKGTIVWAGSEGTFGYTGREIDAVLLPLLATAEHRAEMWLRHNLITGFKIAQEPIKLDEFMSI